MRKITVAVIVCTLIWGTAHIAQAADGDLDASWGGDGLVISSHNENSVALMVVNYPGNKVLAVGSVDDNNPTSHPIIARFLSDGTLDISCNSSGGTPGEVIDISKNGYANDVVVLGDGSFLVTGSFESANQNTLFLSKYNANCVLDSNFGTAGNATYSTALGTVGRALAIQPDGKIVVAGYQTATQPDGGGSRILLVRFTATGLPDNGFGIGGAFVTNVRQGDATDVVIDNRGGLIFTASVDGLSNNDTAGMVGRLSSTGVIDTNFATNGYFIDQFGGDTHLYSMALKANGNIVTIGKFVDPNSLTSPLLLCLTASGIPDTSCGSSGWHIFPITGDDHWGNGIAVAGDGSLFISGVSTIGTYQPTVMRMTADGQLDTNFATNGMWRDSSRIGALRNLAIQNDGRIIAAGFFEDQNNLSFGVVRLANTVIATTTTTTTTTSTTTTPTTSPTTSVSDQSPTTMVSSTIAAELLPATGSDRSMLIAALLLFFIGATMIGVRRRTFS